MLRGGTEIEKLCKIHLVYPTDSLLISPSALSCQSISLGHRLICLPPLLQTLCRLTPPWPDFSPPHFWFLAQGGSQGLVAREIESDMESEYIWQVRLVPPAKSPHHPCLQQTNLPLA